MGSIVLTVNVNSMLTMRFRTKDADFAKYYFPQAIPWIKSDGQIGDKWKYFTHSGPFDYNSIMIYNSNR